MDLVYLTLFTLLVILWLGMTEEGDKRQKKSGTEAAATAIASERPCHVLNKTAMLLRQGTSSAVRYHVGVLSSRKYLGTRAEAVYHTWGKEAGSLSFYVGEAAELTSTLRIIRLAGVNDNSYPPQQKSFEMLKYWCTHHLDRYDWFVRADDDTYMKVALLERLLQGLNPNVKYYIGRARVAIKLAPKVLSLQNNEYCPGQTNIFSKAVMTAICPHIDTCMSQVATLHEDVEVGRCVFFNAGVQCHAGRNPSKLFITDKQTVFGKDLSKRTDIREVMSTHGVKRPDDMYKLHFLYKQWLHTANLSSPLYRNNPFDIKSVKANLTKEICRQVSCTVNMQEMQSH